MIDIIAKGGGKSRSTWLREVVSAAVYEAIAADKVPSDLAELLPDDWLTPHGERVDVEPPPRPGKRPKTA